MWLRRGRNGVNPGNPLWLGMQWIGHLPNSAIWDIKSLPNGSWETWALLSFYDSDVWRWEGGGGNWEILLLFLTVNVCGAFLRNTTVIRHIFTVWCQVFPHFPPCEQWIAITGQKTREKMWIFFRITKILLFCTVFLSVACNMAIHSLLETVNRKTSVKNCWKQFGRIEMQFYSFARGRSTKEVS